MARSLGDVAKPLAPSLSGGGERQSCEELSGGASPAPSAEIVESPVVLDSKKKRVSERSTPGNLRRSILSDNPLTLPRLAKAGPPPLTLEWTPQAGAILSEPVSHWWTHLCQCEVPHFKARKLELHEESASPRGPEAQFCLSRRRHRLLVLQLSWLLSDMYSPDTAVDRAEADWLAERGASAGLTRERLPRYLWKLVQQLQPATPWTPERLGEFLEANHSCFVWLTKNPQMLDRRPMRVAERRRILDSHFGSQNLLDAISKRPYWPTATPQEEAVRRQDSVFWTLPRTRPEGVHPVLQRQPTPSTSARPENSAAPPPTRHYSAVDLLQSRLALLGDRAAPTTRLHLDKLGLESLSKTEAVRLREEGASGDVMTKSTRLNTLLDEEEELFEPYRFPPDVLHFRGNPQTCDQATQTSHCIIGPPHSHPATMTSGCEGYGVYEVPKSVRREHELGYVSRIQVMKKVLFLHAWVQTDLPGISGGLTKIDRHGRTHGRGGSRLVQGLDPLHSSPVMQALGNLHHATSEDNRGVHTPRIIPLMGRQRRDFYKQPKDPVGRILRRQHMSRQVQARADQQEEEAALRQLLNPSPALSLLPGSDALLSASLHSSSLLRSQTVLHSTSSPPIDPFVNWVSNEMRTELVKSNPPMQVMRMVPT